MRCIAEKKVIQLPARETTGGSPLVVSIHTARKHMVAQWNVQSPLFSSWLLMLCLSLPVLLHSRNRSDLQAEFSSLL